MNTSPFCALLRRLRMEANLSRDELADQAGVPRLLVARLESVITSRPSPETLHKLATALGVPVERLIVPSAKRSA